MSELSEHIEGMADSLDEHVTHEDVHRLLIEALHLSWEQDKKLRAIAAIPATLQTEAKGADGGYYDGIMNAANIIERALRNT